MAAIPLLLLSGASPGLLPPVTHCQRIEINTFGTEPRTAVVFWDHAGNVIDWRWENMVALPRRTRPGHWEATWKEGGRLVHVTAEQVTRSRTRDDVELMERKRLPDHLRAKLR